jgi:hypothetical protein
MNMVFINWRWTGSDWAELCLHFAYKISRWWDIQPGRGFLSSENDPLKVTNYMLLDKWPRNVSGDGRESEDFEKQ